jgi:hypothetical protein
MITNVQYNANLHINPKLAPYNAIGDGIADDEVAIQAAGTAAKAAGKDLWFPNGTYRLGTSGIFNTGGVQWIGQDKVNSILSADNATTQFCIESAQNLTFKNLRPYDLGLGKYRQFFNVAFISTIDNPATLMFAQGAILSDVFYEFDQCSFAYGTIACALQLINYAGVIVRNCTFSGVSSSTVASRPIQLFEPSVKKAPIIIEYNLFIGGRNGVLLRGNRIMPYDGGRIVGNTFKYQDEEGLSYDGIANNFLFNPVIAQGVFTSVSNDVNGRVVISMSAMQWYDGTSTVSSPVSLRSDWTNFFFAFGDGSGFEGVFTEIYSSDSVANTITLDTFIDASQITIGGVCNINSGLFNFEISQNKIIGCKDGTGISLWQNCFNTTVTNNYVSGCKNALTISGGAFLGPYLNLAWHNDVHDNYFEQLPDLVDDATGVNFQSRRVDSGKQYGNKFYANTVLNGNIFLQKQSGFRYANNSFLKAILTITNQS